MARLTAIDPTRVSGKAKDLLDEVRDKLGRAPNMMRTMANSPAVLQAYVAMSGALTGGALPAKLRE